MRVNKTLRRLPLDGTQNTRELGGYPCEGGATRYGVFLRSDNPATLTRGDLVYLKSYGITTAVDLRRNTESQRSPSALAGSGRFTSHAISLNDNMHNIDFEGDLPGSMAGLYITLLNQNRAEIAAVFNALAAAKGGVLFHCAVGKDRTGVIAMLLLKCVGVSNNDVIADYAISDIYMRDVYDEQSRVFQTRTVHEYVLRSLPASMQRLLLHLYTEYGSAQEYLLGCGVSADALQQIRRRFVAPL